MTRRLAISNIAWNPDEEDAVARILRDNSFLGVEIAPTTRWPAPLEAPRSAVVDYRQWWEDRGLSIIAMQSLLFGREDLALFGTEAQRRALIDYLAGIAELAAVLGAHSLVFGSPKNRRRGAMPLAEALPSATELFREIGTHMSAHGVVLCIEANPAEYGCDFITTMAEAIALATAVGSPGIGVQGDLGAITLNGETAEVLGDAGAHLKHVHASEPHLAETGTAGADHAAAATTLREIGYDGWVSIEMKKTSDARLEAVARAVSFTRDVYGD